MPHGIDCSDNGDDILETVNFNLMHVNSLAGLHRGELIPFGVLDPGHPGHPGHPAPLCATPALLSEDAELLSPWCICLAAGPGQERPSTGSENIKLGSADAPTLQALAACCSLTVP